MSTTELLPCPFCGGNFCETKYLGGQWQEPSAFESGWRGECSDCGALTRAFPTEAEAIEAWNTRAAREEIVRCRDCVFFASDYSTVDLSGNVIATGNFCEWTELWVKPIDFCSQGERWGDAE